MSALLEALAKDGVEGELVGNKPMALPTSEAQVQAVLKRAHADGLRVVPMGLGSKLKWCRPEYITSADLLVSTRRMDKIIDYVPGDGTLTAQAGCTMTQLEEHVLTGGHRLLLTDTGERHPVTRGLEGSQQDPPHWSRWFRLQNCGPY